MAILLITTGLALKAISLYQATSPKAISHWQQSNEDNPQVIDHQLWQAFLARYLIDQSPRRFDYSQVNDHDKALLDSYLISLQIVDPITLRQDEQLAYWVNLYNALVIKLVLDNYPLKSIKEIGDGITGPWNIELITLGVRPLSLNQIEHGILRPLWQDPRIHYVINCASVGCPDLPLAPLTGATIEQQLEQAAHRFINQDKAVVINDNVMTLSSIYQWFSVDFGENDQQLLTHLMQYAKPPLQQQLAQFNGEIEFSYNWKLNSPD